LLFSDFDLVLPVCDKILVRLRFYPLTADLVLVLFNHALTAYDPSPQVLVPSHDQYIYFSRWSAARNEHNSRCSAGGARSPPPLVPYRSEHRAPPDADYNSRAVASQADG
jgi:hypothetical protein